MEKACNYNFSTMDSRGTIHPNLKGWGILYPLTPRE